MLYFTASITFQIGRLTAPFPIPEEIEIRETKIREYFLREIDRLITEKHIYHVRNLAIAANVRIYIYSYNINSRVSYSNYLIIFPD